MFPLYSRVNRSNNIYRSKPHQPQRQMYGTEEKNIVGFQKKTHEEFEELGKTNAAAAKAVDAIREGDSTMVVMEVVIKEVMEVKVEVAVAMMTLVVDKVIEIVMEVVKEVVMVVAMMLVVEFWREIP